MGNNIDYEADLVVMVFVGLLFFSILGLIGCVIDDLYKLPQASETANQMCKDQGYDFYESFERIGVFSTTPIAIKCKYVENYKEMNIALRQTYGSGLDELNDLERN